MFHTHSMLMRICHIRQLSLFRHTIRVVACLCGCTAHGLAKGVAHTYLPRLFHTATATVAVEWSGQVEDVQLEVLADAVQ